MAATFPYPVLWSGGTTWADADPQPADIEGIAHWHDTSIDTHLVLTQTTKPTLKVAVDGILVMNELQSARWRMGRRGWFSKLEVGSGAFSFIGLVDGEPSDHVVVYCEHDVLWAGYVENVNSTRDASGIWYSNIDAVDVLGRYGKTELVDYSPTDLIVGWGVGQTTPEQYVILAFEQFGVNALLTEAYTTGSGTTPYFDYDFSGDLLGFISRQEELGNIVITQTRGGDLKYLKRQASASYNLPVIPLTGDDSPSQWSERISSTDTINRWYSENQAGSVFLNVTDEDAADQYGVRDIVFDGPSGWTALSGGVWPTGLFETLVAPRPILDEGSFHILSLQQGVLMLEPLDVVEHNSELWSVMNVQHEVSLDDWVVKIGAERSNNYITGEDEFTFDYPTDPVYATQTETYAVDDFVGVEVDTAIIDSVITETYIGVGKGYPSYYRHRLVISPDLSAGWPVGAVGVQSAKLWYYQARVPTTYTIDASFDDFLLFLSDGNVPKTTIERRTESTVNEWAGPATSEGSSTATGTEIDYGGSILTLKSADITDIAKAWFSGAGYYGVRLTSVNEGGNYRNLVMATPAHSNPDYHPYFTITFLVPAP